MIDALAAKFERLSKRRILRIEDGGLAAQQFDWLVLSIPINRAMFDARLRFSDDERDRCAEQAVRMFLAAHRTSCFNGLSTESIFGARTP